MKRVLIIFLAIMGVYLLMNINFTKVLPFAKGESEAKTTNKTETILIDVGSIKTVIIPEKRSTVEAELTGKGAVSVSKNGNSIEVHYNPSFIKLPLLNLKRELTIYIPESFDRHIDINGGSGQLVFKGDSIKKPMKLDKLSIDISSGMVDLELLDIGELYLDGSSGMVKMDEVKAANGVVAMSSGYISIKEYEGGLKAEVSSGKLDVDVKKLVSDVSLKASSGHIKLELPIDADYRFKARYNSGLLKTDIDLKEKKQDKHSLEGIVGKGNHTVNVSVTSGIIDVK